jgi:FlaA1/EpsC-like NDP-sugar epimerase
MDDSIGKYFKGKNVLITGGAGSIGSEIARKLLTYDVGLVRILDINEAGQFKLEQELSKKAGRKKGPRFLIGDVRDGLRTKRAMEGIDIVFHAAALKHVPMCEYNAFEAAKTNVFGAQNVIEAAMDANVEKFIAISTDKAVNPVNVMGATKLLEERLTISANYYKGDRRTAFSCVRFGNVWGTSGSVVEVFTNQICAGGPVTVTDPDMTRFVMSTSRAVELVLKAAQMASGGEIFIFKMPSLKIGDLAGVMVEELGPRCGCKPGGVKIKIVGIRPGEKFHEELMTEEESVWAKETKEMFIVQPPIELPTLTLRRPGEQLKAPLTESYASKRRKKLTSKDVRLLTKREIKQLLREA